MENCRFTTTQDMFLERVGITNSFNDDNEYRHKPFFVSLSTIVSCHILIILGGKRHSILSYQEEGIIFRHIFQKERFESSISS
jgi:hypothetical protein